MVFKPHLFAAALCAGLASGGVTASEAIAAKAGCGICHATVNKADKKMMGPSYQEMAAKYKGRADAVAVVSDMIRKGSKGVWGPQPMPPTLPSKLSDADLKAVATWLLTIP